MQPFIPLFRNPHLLTVLAYLWPPRLDERRFPVERRLYPTEPGIEVLVESQRPAGQPRAEIVMVHGLEGSSRARYLRRTSRFALEAGYAVHRINLRSCGGTERYGKGAYHSGLTADLEAVLEQLSKEGRGPLFTMGVSLGGNVVLKLAGEMGTRARGLLAGVCAISTPLDLSACVAAIERTGNGYYERRFLKQLKRRVRVLDAVHPGCFPIDGLETVTRLREFDNRFTSRWFGFRDAAEYYDTQSSGRFLDTIRVPALLIQAKDDPMVPFEVYERIAKTNPSLEFVCPEHGGHLGFIARRRPFLWADALFIEWMARHLEIRTQTMIA